MARLTLVTIAALLVGTSAGGQQTVALNCPLHLNCWAAAIDSGDRKLEKLES